MSIVFTRYMLINLFLKDMQISMKVCGFDLLYFEMFSDLLDDIFLCKHKYFSSNQTNIRDFFPNMPNFPT